jgi:L-lactate dehydrogenase complex protein LldG
VVTSRESSLARVRTAAAAGRQYRVHPRPFPPDAGYQGAGDDLVGRFVEEVRAVGGLPQVAADRAAARAAVAAILRDCGARQALCWQHPALDRLGLAELLAEQGVERVDFAALAPLDQAEQRQQMLACGIGITGVHWAVAETGTVVVASGAGTERLASLAPPVYITLVERGQILPDLFDLFARIDPAAGAELPSNLALITGPSKTGDIELRLTTGVHGPGMWHVVVVE